MPLRRATASLLISLAVAGCDRNVEAPTPRPERPVAPITALQVEDLLSDKVQDRDGNLFVAVEPQECSGMSREVDPPLIFDLDPAATDGGHWVDTNDSRDVVIDEAAGVYHAGFDPKQALGQTERTIEACRGVPFTVTDMRGREYHFHLLPQVNSGSPDIVLYSFQAPDWACDNAFVAAHNAAVRISTCAAVNGYDVLSLAQDALKRIEKLANTTA
ncbi:sensor domain-containing protein [Mycobacterium sp. ACS1612]|uniref:sensor domain-containing protein n=1 Tax=Mycobacterium sp. ACS1612 TaxID=1834117 RepID=UPI0009EF1BAB|nr:sensor domain-containing protein [Mycobacterium sp. ACS1612]